MSTRRNRRNKKLKRRRTRHKKHLGGGPEDENKNINEILRKTLVDLGKDPDSSPYSEEGELPF